MTNLITLTIPNDDHVALRAFGKALEEMALAHGASPKQLQVVNEITMSDGQDGTPRERLKEVLGEPEVDTTTQQVESLIQKQQPLGEDFEKVLVDNIHELYMESTPTTDSTGTSWDERIHSASKALNSDGTWRLRRKPKDMDEAAWAAFVETVKGEISERAIDEYAESINDALTTHGKELDVKVTPPTEDLCVDEGCDHHGTPHVCVTLEPPVTPPGDDFHTDSDVVSEQTVAGIPPLPVPPPVVVVPPVPEVTTWDFPRLMTFLTERHGKIDVATVNTLLAQDGLASLQELNAHPDKIGPFVARVKAHLGE